MAFHPVLWHRPAFPAPWPDMDLLRTDAYTFDLPQTQIAAHPVPNRDASRLLVVDDELSDLHFHDLTDRLQPGDLLVVNDAKVSPVRLIGARESGGRVEVFVLGFADEGVWGDNALTLTALTRSNRRLRMGEEVVLSSGQRIRLTHRDDHGRAHFDTLGAAAWSLIDAAGAMPLPPYIEKRRRDLGEDVQTDADRERYQTRFARVPGAVAAPTAGLHFSDTMLETLTERGVNRASVTLFVGAGTFKPVTAEVLTEHPMHVEYYDVPEATRAAILETQAAGGRVVAVGTTVVRTLEAAAQTGALRSGPGSTDLFIYPGFTFRVVDAIITNFHLPASTLIALVAAFGGHQRVMDAYAHAVRTGYRFYSYGDAMFLPRRLTTS